MAIIGYTDQNDEYGNPIAIEGPDTPAVMPWEGLTQYNNLQLAPQQTDANSAGNQFYFIDPATGQAIRGYGSGLKADGSSINDPNVVGLAYRPWNYSESLGGMFATGSQGDTDLTRGSGRPTGYFIDPQTGQVIWTTPDQGTYSRTAPVDSTQSDLGFITSSLMEGLPFLLGAYGAYTGLAGLGGSGLDMNAINAADWGGASTPGAAGEFAGGAANAAVDAVGGAAQAAPSVADQAATAAGISNEPMNYILREGPTTPGTLSTTTVPDINSDIISGPVQPHPPVATVDITGAPQLPAQGNVYDDFLTPGPQQAVADEIRNMPNKGILDKILDVAKMPSSVGGQVLASAITAGGGALSGAYQADAQKALLDKKLENEIALANAKRDIIQRSSYFNAKLPFRAGSTRTLRRPDGTLVYSGGGLINAAMRR